MSVELQQFSFQKNQISIGKDRKRNARSVRKFVKQSIHKHVTEHEDRFILLKSKTIQDFSLRISKEKEKTTEQKVHWNRARRRWMQA
jgi:hypothetical protein